MDDGLWSKLDKDTYQYPLSASSDRERLILISKRNNRYLLQYFDKKGLMKYQKPILSSSLYSAKFDAYWGHRNKRTDDEATGILTRIGFGLVLLECSLVDDYIYPFRATAETEGYREQIVEWQASR